MMDNSDVNEDFVVVNTDYENKEHDNLECVVTIHQTPDSESLTLNNRTTTHFTDNPQLITKLIPIYEQSDDKKGEKAKESDVSNHCNQNPIPYPMPYLDINYEYPVIIDTETVITHTSNNDVNQVDIQDQGDHKVSGSLNSPVEVKPESKIKTFWREFLQNVCCIKL